MEDNIDTMDDQEAEETLSLCDLATQKDDHDAADHWEDFSRVSQSSSSAISSPDQQDDFFEFFSEDWSTNSNPYPPEHIIFCGKCIGDRQPRPVSDTMNTLESEQTIHKRRGLFRWNSDSLPKAKTSKRNGHKIKQKLHDNISSSSKQTQNTRKLGKVYDLSVHQKMSILTSSASKSRWYLFFFGMARVPTEMELKSIKSRQSRQSPSSSPLLQLKGGGGDQEVNACRKKTKGLWGLIRVLGCVGHHHATNIQPSMRTIPRV